MIAAVMLVKLPEGLYSSPQFLLFLNNILTTEKR